MVKSIFFGLGSLGFVLKEREALTNPRVHGFYRFFSFEAIFALILLNIDVWFDDPLAISQIISWLLLTASAVLVVWGVYLLKKVGMPEGEFENTTQLVNIGIYKYIRHPLYSSLLFLAWGVFLKHVSLPSGVLVSAATIFLLATAKVEEKENLEKFGVEYESYIKITRMFIPFLF
jgi:protein-S-isoprenylcysteine O-methyltransferase Ste14